MGVGGMVGSVCELRRGCCSLGGHAAAIRGETGGARQCFVAHRGAVVVAGGVGATR